MLNLRGIDHVVLRVRDIEVMRQAAPGKEGRNMDHLCLRVEPFDPEQILSYLKSNGVAAELKGP